MRKRRAPGRGRGAYLVRILLTDEVTIRLNGRAGKAGLAPGRHVYSGSAKEGIGERVARPLPARDDSSPSGSGPVALRRRQ